MIGRSGIKVMMLSLYDGIISLVPFWIAFFSQELREVKAEEFMNLKEGNMIVKESTLKFHQLFWYVPELVPSMRKFSFGLSLDLFFESKAALLNKELNISKLMVYMQQAEEER